MLAWLSRRCIYIRFDRDVIWARCVTLGREFRDSPDVALQFEGARRAVLGVGSDCAAVMDQAHSVHAPGITIVNPFGHERLVVQDFEVAEALLRYALFKISDHPIQRKPDIILHPLRELAGGLTDIERRVLSEIAVSAGASRVAVHLGPELSDEDAKRVEVSEISGVR